tara:strand:+ start:54 stop:632 length:579 start_codon:yes stop_codon:yes gene_type:complete
MASILEDLKSVNKEDRIKAEQAFYIQLASKPLENLDNYTGWEKIQEIKDRIEIFEGLIGKKAISTNPNSDKLLKKRGLNAAKLLRIELDKTLEKYNNDLNKRASSNNKNKEKKKRQRKKKKTIQRMLRGDEPEGGWDTIGELGGKDKEVSSKWGGKKHKKRKTNKRNKKHNKKTKKRKSKKSKKRKTRKKRN